ncbi:efflux RND transporter periplasmic adaptor subunit [candidate division WOR-3 bacterium]|uniref:Efflux RND transporter periplasmic adaptor subunit n=1 Tax=candidate division WOR-3 bacterium TaxID=2052148 RepID=A0A937XGX9_UNCW3|nr:efflux RND transporter periplasmic adaptor subunit [candidate division WOR-3 bacterium]
MKKRTRTIVILAAVVVLFGIIVVANLKSKTGGGEEVETQKVKFGSILSKVSATGGLRAQAQVNLQAQVMGVVDKLPVKEGDWVNRGDLLLELDRRSYEANLVLARARFDQARASHTRVESLYSAKLIASEAHEASRAALEMASAQYDQARDQYDKTIIRAPISGTVARLNIEEGEAVMIGTMNYSGTVLMVLADMSRMQALIDVDEADVVSVATGQVAKVFVDALPDTSFPGHITRIAHMPTENVLSATQQSTTFEVEVTLDSSAPALRPGMNVRAEITTAELDSVLVIPVQAAGRREVKGKETETVFLLKDGKAVLTSIRTGKTSETEIQVTDGLKPGDEVVTGPYKKLAKLTEGRRLTGKPAKDSMPDKASPE